MCTGDPSKWYSGNCIAEHVCFDKWKVWRTVFEPYKYNVIVVSQIKRGKLFMRCISVLCDRKVSYIKKRPLYVCITERFSFILWFLQLCEMLPINCSQRDQRPCRLKWMGICVNVNFSFANRNSMAFCSIQSNGILAENVEKCGSHSIALEKPGHVCFICSRGRRRWIYDKVICTSDWQMGNWWKPIKWTSKS